MDRLEKLRLLLKEKGASAALLTSFPSQLYFSGFTGEDAYLFITENEQYIITDSRYTIQAQNECKAFTLVDGSCTDFSLIKPLAEKENIKSVGFEDENISVSNFEKIKSKLPFADFVPLGSGITVLRRTKSHDEVKKIKESLRLAEYALSKTLPQIKAGMSEMEVAAILESFMRSGGSKKTSFDTICASGIRSAMPHGTAGGKIIENGDFITLDFGCVLDGYCSDITRTFVVGAPSDRQKEIYNIVLKAQSAAENIIAPSLAAKDADAAARSIIEKSGFGANFGHALGHGVGIEIHELPTLSPRSQAPLTPGDIVTVEPGIYIDGFGGVRIEDIAFIDDSGTEILTKFTKELISL